MKQVAAAELEWSVRVTMTGPPQLYRCERTWSWSPPPLPDFDLWYAAAGHGTLEWDGARHVVRPGRCFLLGPGSRVSAGHDPRRPLVVLAGHFALARRRDVRQLADLARRPVDVADPVLFEAAGELAIRAWQRGDAHGRRLAAVFFSSLIAALLAPPCRRERPADPRLQELMRAIDMEPGADWRVPTMARRVGLSESQLNRQFQAAVGRPPVQYVLARRLARARSLLRESSLNVSEVAFALGYRDVYFFSRQYRARFGVPPSQDRGAATPGQPALRKVT